ncbi:MAG: hypothetical protein Q8Q60_02595 [Candidatus Chromulinivorax sp.]|nr:hypothetical protein [Candidatus Chromulinivorax sp.]
MKRLIMVSMMFISGLVYAEDAVIPLAPAAVQSPHDASSKNSEDVISIANVHHIDLDTIDVDGGGNWLNKRIWYQKSQTLFGGIRVMIGNLGDVRVQFSHEVNAIGQKIDSFWETVDYTKGELDDKFKEILTMLDVEQKFLGDLSVDERNLQVSIKEQLSVIDQLGKDIKSIHDMDDKIDETLSQAFKTIDECRDYETKSWDSFTAIGKELDDKKARNLYYQISNYKQNIEQKINYLKSTLLPYLHNDLVVKVEMNISKINDAIEKLKAKGIDLEKIMSKNQEDDIVHLHAREKAAAEIAVKKAVEDEQAKAKEAAEKAAKDLEEAHQKSFTNVMNRYYESTIGKIVGFFHLRSSIDSATKSITSYSFPVATYVHHAMISVTTYMSNLVHDIMIYFGGASAVKKAITEKIVEKVEDKQHIIEAVKEKVEAVAQSENKGTEVAAPSISEQSFAAPTAVSLESHESVSATPVANQNVAIQSIQDDSNNASEKNIPSKEPVSNLYRVIAAIFDLIGSIFIGLYNCIFQFLKLLMKLSAFLMSGN